MRGSVSPIAFLEDAKSVDHVTCLNSCRHAAAGVQATAPPPTPSAPNPVGYDWSKYRAASMRRATSTTKRPTAGHTG